MRQQMEIQAIKKTLLSIGLMFFSILIFGQNKLTNAPFVIVSDINKSNYCYGDTIYFTIKNKTQTDRGYTIEAISVNTSLKSNQVFNSELYTAYFNNDTSFFLSLKKSKQVSKENNIKYLMPDNKVIPHSISADSSSTFFYIVKGNKLKNGVKIKLRIIPDIVDDEPDYIIETKPFWIFVNPM